jgi:hypothetical protein
MAPFKKFTGNLLLVLFSTAVSLLLAEAGCRILYKPIDYLTPDRIADSVLRYRVEPGSGGHDQWGFRNSEVPDSAEIVVIGDSQTYGYNAKLDGSYPAQLQNLTHSKVYNLSLGGYGPLQYNYLLEHYALKLKPKIVIAGLYFGNDIADAFNTVYKNDYWKNLRMPGISQDQAGTPSTDEDVESVKKKKTGIIQRFRHWLAGHSIFYQIITKVAFPKLGSVNVQGKSEKDQSVTYKNPKIGVEKIFTPDSRFRTLDPSTTKVTEGSRLSLNALKAMHALCEKHSIRFVVVFIPTAETVYADHFDTGVSEPGKISLMKLTSAEKQVNTSFRDSLAAAHILFLDAGTALKSKVGVVNAMYLPGPDGHPTAAGYGVIAASINQFLSQL